MRRAFAALLERVPLWATLALAVGIGLAPFVPEPHLWEKLKMLASGALVRPIDIFDLAWHAWPWALVAMKLRQLRGGSGA